MESRCRSACTPARWSCLILLKRMTLLVPLLVLPACGKHEKPGPQGPTVTVTKPQTRSVTEFFYATGNIDAQMTVDLRARVQGYLKSVNFKDGDIVKEGEVLFVIEPEPYQDKVKLAEAQILSAQAELSRSTTEYNRQVGLAAKNATSQADVEKWRAARDVSQAQLDSAKANADLARIDLGYTTVTAPFLGRVERRLVDPGNLVGRGEATLLSTIRRVDTVYAYFHVNEPDLIRIRKTRAQKGEQSSYQEKPIPVELAIEGEPGFPHQGTLDFASAAIDPGTGTLQMRGIFANQSQGPIPWLLPGMFVRLRVPVDVNDNAVLVSDKAFGVDQSGQYLYVVDDKNIAEQRNVKTSFVTDDGLRVVVSGITPNDWVVVEGMQRVRRGAPVNPVKQEAPAQPSPPQPESTPSETTH